MKNGLAALALILVSATAAAQYNYRDSNRIGITVGINQLTLSTSNFDTKPGTGWNAGLSVRGNYYNDWDMIYAIQFSETNFSVDTRNALLQQEDVNYKLGTVQLSLQLSYKFIQNHLSVEFGPILQANGKLVSDSKKDENSIAGTTLTAKDIQDISKFNVYPTVGVTAGVRHFRLNVSYQYGLLNTFGNLNHKDYGGDFKAHAGILNGNLIIYL